MAFFDAYMDSPVFYIVDILIIIYFSFETLFRVKEHTWKKYISSKGNKFDLTILFLSFLFIVLPSESSNSLIYLRLFRLVTIIRIIKITPNAQHIINGLLRAIKATKTIFMFLIIQLILFSLLGFTFFSNTLPQYFGDPFLSMNTIFSIFTLENWGSIPEAAKALNNTYAYYSVNAFVITVLVIGGFISVSLANAVFIDEMASDNNDELKIEIGKLKADITEIKEILKENRKH